MSVTEAFEKWYEELTNEQKAELMIYILRKKFRPLNEGFYGGPAGIVTRGLFAGPAGVGGNNCPVCGRPM